MYAFGLLSCFCCLSSVSACVSFHFLVPAFCFTFSFGFLCVIFVFFLFVVGLAYVFRFSFDFLLVFHDCYQAFVVFLSLFFLVPWLWFWFWFITLCCVLSVFASLFVRVAPFFVRVRVRNCCWMGVPCEKGTFALHTRRNGMR